MLRQRRQSPPDHRPISRFRRLLLVLLPAVLVAPLALAGALLWLSLPKLDGAIDAPDVAAPVSIERDALGIPTITAENRLDLAYGTGFVHGQDRFFQMDLARRAAAGELAELFGEAALGHDLQARQFRFRHLARQVLDAASPEQQALVTAYTRGVNAALAASRSRPWEYWVLTTQPAPWREEDTLLVVYAMWWDLQYSSVRREMVRREINARLGGQECENGWKCSLRFLFPAGTDWDGPIPGTLTVQETGAGALADVDVPSPEELNVREATVPTACSAPVPEREAAVGSNNWALAGALTATGSALVASDMHLRLRVPPVWYRARLRMPGSQGESDLDLNGVTLPGAPLIVAGSNGHVAWSFTNSYGDWLDVTPVPCTGVSDTELRTEEGSVPLSVTTETISVRGGSDVTLPVRAAHWGVLVEARPEQRRCWFVSWLAQVPEATNLNLMALERSRSVAEVMAIAPTVGIPHQNAIVGDRDGHIGWTIFGRIPAASGAERTSGRAPWLEGDDYPRIVDPPSGRLWTANARPVRDPRFEEAIGGDEALLGADYDLGARALQIRDGLFAIDGRATPLDMLRVQLDDRAVFLARWRDLLLELIGPEEATADPRRAEVRRLVADWGGRASVDSVGYRIVRTYRNRLEREVWRMILASLGMDATQTYPPAQFEGPLWQLVSRQPLHLLAGNHASWREFLLGQLDATIAELEASCGSLDRCTWGSRAPVHIRHPLSGALPWLSLFIDLPAVELPGDHDMPRVQDGAFGASERFAVSPGHEEEGFLHLPGGQSAHPLSPYYRAGFREWAEGEPLPFLPGPARHRLELVSRTQAR